MTDTITLTGLVGTEPKHIVTSEGLAITSFRLASTQRRYDKNEGKWVDADTNWYSVTCFRQLAINASGSLKKGERVIVTGRVKIRSWDTGERSGMNVDVEAEAIGHDLLWGTTTFTRSMSNSATPREAPTSEARTSDTPATSASAPQQHSFEPDLVQSVEPEPAF
ncbi:single-strand DNA-binding protein [Microbacteriaceae bacterium SG_E_30_P1]|uniref:Single-stranded DNA-binding protein n=1 Tax=Antiquaquibacter oligotrophicus TaxID=2880260 RepID=A0ABT6KNB4_9MICO|nr:single-stranded DNA-binding protein [Antiquaquibacter oligotrophicus]MDH6181286.1 single-strand DNA-binding protein [Antiquaquibacter oligotrophicus]UDF13021.1 single-stranded DNA-binding protein [Antiquaquibacter oligotrophicus]